MTGKIKKRVLSGMRPTGKLHLGHYIGVLENWKKLQDENDCFFFVADWHALTTEYNDTGKIKDYIEEMVIDWLASGIDCKKCTMFIQSDVIQHAELHLLLSMIVPIPWLERVPSYKEMQENLSERDLTTYGFLGYPLLQAADILIYGADTVPVGIDQVPHIELTREVARRFNYFYGENILIEPQPMLTATSKLPGIDGRKMSKSFNNCIYLSDTPDIVEKKVKQMVTDPQRIKKTDPGAPELSTVYAYHKIFTSPEKIEEIASGCRNASIGCVQCKKILIESLLSAFADFREKRSGIEKKRDVVKDIISEGNKKASQEACKMMESVRHAMKLK